MIKVYHFFYSFIHSRHQAEIAREMTGELIDQAACDAGFPGQSYVKQKEAILSIQGNDTFVSMPTRLFGKSVIYFLYLTERIKGGVLIYLNSSLNIIVIVK